MVACVCVCACLHQYGGEGAGGGWGGGCVCSVSMLFFFLNFITSLPLASFLLPLLVSAFPAHSISFSPKSSTVECVLLLGSESEFSLCVVVGKHFCFALI